MTMRADQLAAYNAAHPDVPTMQEVMDAQFQADLEMYRTADVRVNETFDWDRDYRAVQAGRVIYPGSDLEFALMAIATATSDQAVL